MARKAAPANGKARQKQGYLDGMEPPHIKEIDEAALEYVEARDSRMAMLDTEIKAQERLLQLMQKHKLTVYEFEGREVIVAPGPVKVKVRKAKGEEDADD